MNQINQITYPESVASPSTSHTESLPRISFAIRRALGVERGYSRFEEEEVESPLSHISVLPTIQAEQDQVAVAQTPRVVASVVCVVENGACAFSDAFPPSLRGKLPDSVFEQRIASVNMLLVGVKGLDEYSPLWFGLPLLYAGCVAGFMFGGVLQTTSVWGIVLLIGCRPVLLAAYYLGTSVHNPKYVRQIEELLDMWEQLDIVISLKYFLSRQRIKNSVFGIRMAILVIDHGRSGPEMSAVARPSNVSRFGRSAYLTGLPSYRSPVPSYFTSRQSLGRATPRQAVTPRQGQESIHYEFVSQ